MYWVTKGLNYIYFPFYTHYLLVGLFTKVQMLYKRMSFTQNKLHMWGSGLPQPVLAGYKGGTVGFRS